MNEDIDWYELCKNCGRCCGQIKFKIEFINKHKQDIQKEHLVNLKNLPNKLIQPITNDGYCIFLDRTIKRCKVYNDRPDICKIYGTIEEYPCYILEPEKCKKKDAEIIKKVIENLFKKN